MAHMEIGQIVRRRDQSQGAGWGLIIGLVLLEPVEALVCAGAMGPSRPSSSWTTWSTRSSSSSSEPVAIAPLPSLRRV